MWTPTHLLVPVSTLQVDIDMSYLRAHEILRGLVPEAAIHHVGSTAIPELLCRSELDIELLVAGQEIAEANQRIASAKELSSLPLPVKVRVGNRQRANAALYIRQRLIDDPILVGEFRGLQKALMHEVGRPYPDAKREFFSALWTENREQSSLQPLPYRIELATDRLILVSALACDGAAKAAYRRRNREHLAPFAPEQSEAQMTEEHWQERFALQPQQHWRQQGLELLCYRKSDLELVGSIGFSRFQRGPLQSCSLGYNIDASCERQGLMTEALNCALTFVFSTFGVHRICAAYSPENLRSEALLTRLGFRVEGHAQEYIRLGERWVDSVLVALTR